MKDIEIQNHRMGIKSKLEETPSLVLGSSDVCLEEMLSAYCTVVDDGKAKDPVLVARILDHDGNEIFADKNMKEQALSYRTAFFMQQMLMGGLREPGGTSQGMWRYVRQFDDTDFGGKTGTTNNHADAWYISVSPRLVCGAWVGGEYRPIHFRTSALGQGARAAMPLCGAFIEKVFSDKHFQHYHAKFAPPRDPNILDNMYLQCGWGDNDENAEDDTIIYFPAAVNYPEKESTTTIDGPEIPDLPISIETGGAVEPVTEGE